MKRLSTRLSILNIALIAVATACVGVISSVQIEAYYRNHLVAEILRQSSLFEALLRRPVPPPYDELAHMAKLLGVRLTVIAADGRVLFDSEVAESRLPSVENHGERPEIKMARAGRVGVDTRQSHTVHVDLLYVARRLSTPVRGNAPEYVRIAVPLHDVKAATAAIRLKVAIGCGAALILALAGSLVIARRVSKPIARLAAAAEEIKKGNLDTAIEIGGGAETAQLGQALRDMLDKLRHDMSELKRLERVRSEFLGNVSHELRTPIFAVQGFIETLLGGAVDDAGVNRDFLRKALDHAVRLSSLLNDLIEISRIESGEMKLSLRYFDLNELFEEVRREMMPIAEQKELRLELQSVGGCQVLGDRDRIHQVLTNLVDNAIKYTERGGVVRISATREDAAYRISVADTGCGIAAEHLPRIFERFYRVDKVRSRDLGGTGLGLAIVKHIVEAHGSSVGVTSTLGQGSVFSFTLKR